MREPCPVSLTSRPLHSCFPRKAFILPLLPNLPFLWEPPQHTALIPPKHCYAFYAGLLCRPQVPWVERQSHSYSPFYPVPSTYQTHSKYCLHLGTFLRWFQVLFLLHTHGNRVCFLAFQVRRQLHIVFYPGLQVKSVQNKQTKTEAVGRKNTGRGTLAKQHHNFIPWIVLFKTSNKHKAIAQDWFPKVRDWLHDTAAKTKQTGQE